MIKHRLFILLFLIIFLDGCSSDDDINQYVENVKSKKVLPVKKFPQLSISNDTSSEKLMMKRDLFKPVIDENKLQTEEKQLQSLTHFPLHSLHFVGTMKKELKTFGLVLLPTQEIMRVEIGTEIGLHRGIVTAINDDAIVIETVKIVSGEMIKHQSVIKIQASPNKELSEKND